MISYFIFSLYFSYYSLDVPADDDDDDDDDEYDNADWGVQEDDEENVYWGGVVEEHDNFDDYS
jgi:hypothetical protein